MLPAVSPFNPFTSPAKEKKLRMEGETVAFTATELKKYISLSEKYYGVRPTEQEALTRCTMLVRFLQVVCGDGNAADDASRSGHSSIG